MPEVSTKTSGSTASSPPPRSAWRSRCTGARPAPAPKSSFSRGNRRAARERVPAPPGGLQLRGVADDRRPPVRQVAGEHAARLGAGVDEDRLAGELGGQQHARGPLPRERGEQVGGRQLEADEPVVGEQGAQRGRSGSSAGTEAQARKWSGELADAAVPGVDQRLGLGTRQRLDPQRSGEADAGRAHPRLAVHRDPRLDVVACRVHVVRRFAVGVQRPAAQVRRPGAGAQPVDELVGPQVLVHVEARASWCPGI